MRLLAARTPFARAWAALPRVSPSYWVYRYR